MGRKLINEVGNKYGRLTVIRMAEGNYRGQAQWLCLCECGTEKVVCGGNLRGGITQSCGCLRSERVSERSTINLVGNRYGKLVVLRRAGSNKRGNSTWVCQCDCGEIAVVHSGNLTAGHTKSCGCSKGKTLPRGIAAFHRVRENIKGNAEGRGFKYNLTDEQLLVVTKQNCFYCGTEPSQGMSRNRYGINGAYIYNGLDRVDNGKGYTIDNVVPCCGICNGKKSDMAIDEFRNWVISVYRNWASCDASTSILTQAGNLIVGTGAE